MISSDDLEVRTSKNRKKRILAVFAVLLLSLRGATAQQQQEIQLPTAAHKVDQLAGSFTDPLTKNQIYRLSDRKLCPGGANHTYSWSLQFSRQGRMLFQCFQALPQRQASFVVYDENFKLLFDDLMPKVGLPRNARLVQWSQSEEVVYAVVGPRIFRSDPFVGKSREVVDLSAQGASGIRDMWIGPKDRIVATLQRAGRPGVFSVVVFDAPSGSIFSSELVRDERGRELHQVAWTQNPEGKIIFTWSGDGGDQMFGLNLRDSWKLPTPSHYGFLTLSNGRFGVVKNFSECRSVGYWRREYAILDDETGKPLVMFGCDVPGQHNWEHWGRSISVPDIFSITTQRYTFPPSAEWQPTYEAVLLGRVLYRGGSPSTVRITPIAYHRSAAGDRAKAKGRECGYWAFPRGALDHSGTRVMFDSTMSHPEWPALEVDGKPKMDCTVDVYVVVAAQQKISK